MAVTEITPSFPNTDPAYSGLQTAPAASSTVTQIPNSPTAHAESTQFGVAPPNFAAGVDPSVKALAEKMGWPVTDQGLYNLLALMRVSGGNDGFFDTGDIVSGAIAMGYQIDSQQSLQALADFRNTFANGTTGNEASMAAALKENTAKLNELAGQDLSQTMFAKTDTPAAKKLFHGIVKELATAVSNGDTSAWVAEYPWLSNIDLMNLNFDWDHLNLKDPTPGGRATEPADADSDEAVAAASGNEGEYVSSL
ncbi:MAG: hypothetical protein AB1516_00040 [Pseudomonadota bacterium]